MLAAKWHIPVLAAICISLHSTCASLATSKLLNEAHHIETWLRDVRRTFHATPELMYEENNTSKLIRDYLDAMGIPYKYPYAKTGVVAEIGSGDYTWGSVCLGSGPLKRTG